MELTKFLVDKKGNVIKWYEATIDPLETEQNSELLQVNPGFRPCFFIMIVTVLYLVRK